ncbi:hypothetical protein KOPIIPEJ_02291 [Aeromonas dhakensis]|uniref:glycosyltransferase family 4 protein n=1 Tax=Aeromonas dhakensis TaxID=196024 RepID=UPI0004AE95A9
MYRILMVSESYRHGGVETYIDTMSSWLHEKDCKLYLATGESNESKVVHASIDKYYCGLKLSHNNSLAELLKTIDELRNIIREQNIDVVHAHPFGSIIPSVFAAKLENKKLVLTVHGPSTITSFSGAPYNDLLRYIIGCSVDLTLYVSEEMKFISEPFFRRDGMILPNFFDFNELNNRGRNDKNIVHVSKQKWVVVSRIDAQKLPGIIHFIELASRSNQIYEVDIIGNGPVLEELIDYIKSHGFLWVNIIGEVAKPSALFEKYFGVAGMGRALLEGIIAGMPSVLVGYDGVKGIVNNALFEKAKTCNFSGRSLRTVEEEDFERDLTNIKILDEIEVCNYDVNKVLPSYLTRLDQVDTTAPEVLYSLYYYLQSSNLTNASDESYISSPVFLGGIYTYATRRNIDHLYQRIYDLEETMSQRLHDANITNKFHNEGVADKLSRIEASLKTFYSYLEHKNVKNKSIKINRMKSLFLNIKWLFDKNKRYVALKNMYWSLPEWLRLKLDRYRHRYVQKKLLSNASNINLYKNVTTEECSVCEPDWLLAAKNSSKLLIVPCGFEFDELVNQRPINAAKEFSALGFTVLFVAWQWSPNEKLSKGCGLVYDKVYQVPLYEFMNSVSNINYYFGEAIFLITMPAKIFLDVSYVLRRNNFSIVYDIMDEWEEFNLAGQAPWYKKDIEEGILLSADSVFCVAPSLKEKFSFIREDIDVLGNGYSEIVLGDNKFIADRNAKKIGYVGHLTDAWFDWDFIFRLALDNKEYEIHIIGYGEPDYIHDVLKKHSNIFFHGKVYPKDLHKHIRHWSIGLIPFKKGKLSQAVDPIKIYEYLFFGLDVIVTGIEHLSSYPNTVVVDVDKERLEQVNIDELKLRVNKKDINEFLLKTSWHARFEYMEKISKNKRIGCLYDHE